MPLGEIGGVRGDLVSDDAVLHVVLVGQSEVLLGRDVAQHRGAEPADHRGADRARDVVVARRDVGGERPQRVERRLVAVLELEVHVLLDELHRDVAGTFDHHLHVVLPRDPGKLAQRLQFRDLRLVVGVVNRARSQPVAERERYVVGLENLADVLEARVEEALLVMREAPLRHDRAAARDDARHAFGGQGNVGEPHAGVHREVVHALLALLDQCVTVNFPGELLGFPLDFFQRLIDRHGADRDRGVADDPLARLVDVPAGGEIHHRVRAPARGPRHLLHFLLDAGSDGRVADVGVDLHQEVAADDHRLGLRVVDVGGNDGAPARDLVAHELRRDLFLDRGAERFPRMLLGEQLRQQLAALVLANGDEFHLGRNDAAARVVHLGNVHARFRPARPAFEIEPQLRELGIGEPLAAVSRAWPGELFGIAALTDPFFAQRREPLPDVYAGFGIGVRPGSVVDEDRRVFLRAEQGRRIRLRDLAHRHADVRP